MSVLLPSRKSTVARNVLHTPNLLSPRPHSYRHLCVVYDHYLHIPIIEFAARSASPPHPNDEKGVCRPHTQGVSHVFMEDSCCGVLSFSWGL